MPTNAQIHADIELYVTAQRSHILNNRVAQILHDMVDNITAGGGGTPTLDQVLAAGSTLTETRTIQLNGKVLFIDNNERHFGKFEGTAGAESVEFDVDDGDESSAILSLTANTGSNGITLRAQRENGNSVGVSASAVDGGLQFNDNDGTFEGVREFADNAAAIAGGLTDGMTYRTGDFQKIVHE